MKVIYSILVSFLVFNVLLPDSCWANSIIVSDGEQKKQDTNQLDKNGKKQGKWIFYGKDKPKKGYEPHIKIAEGKFLHGRKTGVWIVYYKDGVTPMIRGEYKNNRPNGSFTRYYPNGTIKAQGHYNALHYVGQFKRYAENGTLIFECVYNDKGKKTGAVNYYYKNGQLRFSYLVKNDIPMGTAVRYWLNGDVKEKITYNKKGEIVKTTGTIPLKNSPKPIKKVKSTKQAPTPTFYGKNFVPNGYNKIFNSNRELWMEGSFKNGKLWEGKVYYYDSNGLLLKVEVYKEGHYHSDGQLFSY